MEVAITWHYPMAGIRAYVIYKAEEGQALRLFKTLEGREKGFSDKNLFVSTIYNYKIKALFDDGTESSFSPTIKVNY
jgi:Na+/H+ antiporter NhaB